MNASYTKPRRWILVLAGTVLQMGLGTVYAWSYWQTLLVNWYRWTYTQTAWAFSLSILTLGFSAVWAGYNLRRFGPRRLATCGAALFSLGYLLGGLALYLKSLALFYFGYSVIGGIGIGLGYVTPVTTVAKWFPDKRGLVTGIVVMGFGFGAFAMSKGLAPLLIGMTRGNLATVFVALGVLLGLIMVPTAALIRDPPANPASSVPQAAIAVSGLDTNVRQCLLSGEFSRLWLMFFFNISAGISIISMQSPLAQQVWRIKNPSIEPAILVSYGATLIAVSSLFNGVGRLFWGLVSDRIGRLTTLRIILCTQMVVFGLLMTEHDPWLFSAFICYILLCFGGGFAVMPLAVSDVFGTQRMSVIYGSLLSAWALAGVAGPLLLAHLTDTYPDHAIIYSFLTGVLFLGAGIIVSFVSAMDRFQAPITVHLAADGLHQIA